MELRLDLQHKRFDTAPIARLFTQGENNVDVITLRGAKMYGALDVSQLTFILRAVSEKDTLTEQQLTAATDGDDLVLTWTVTEDFTAVSGLLYLKLRGIDTAGNVVLKLGAEPIYIQADIQGDYAPPQDVLTKALNDMRGQVAAAEEQAGIAKTEADRLVQAGANFKVLGFYLTLDALQTAVPNPARGDAYGVGDNPVYVHVWSGTKWQPGQALGIDLTAYYTKTTVDEKLAGKASAEQGVKADNALTLGERIELKNIDLNNLKTVGSYAVKLSNDILSITNNPFTEAYSLDVSWTLGNDGYITQKAIELYSQKIKSRIFNSWNSNGTWSNWAEYAMGETLTSDKAIYVRKTGNDETGDGSNERPYLTIGKAIEYANNVNGNFLLYIRIGDGVYEEYYMPALISKSIRLVALESESTNPANVTIRIHNNYGKLWARGCDVVIRYLTFESVLSRYNGSIYLESSKAIINNCRLIQTGGSDLDTAGIWAQSISNAVVVNCVFENTVFGVLSQDSTYISVNNNTGNCRNIGYLAVSGIISATGSTPSAPTQSAEWAGGIYKHS